MMRAGRCRAHWQMRWWQLLVWPPSVRSSPEIPAGLAPPALWCSGELRQYPSRRSALGSDTAMPALPEVLQEEWTAPLRLRAR
jgi:hypothetical protein